MSARMEPKSDSGQHYGPRAAPLYLPPSPAVMRSGRVRGLRGALWLSPQETSVSALGGLSGYRPTCEPVALKDPGGAWPVESSRVVFSDLLSALPTFLLFLPPTEQLLSERIR